MAAGFRGPLPFLGLAAGPAVTTETAPRSLLAHWIGGAAAPAGGGGSTAAGFRSLLAPWIGGAGAADAAPPASDSGPRSLLAFWVGGAAVVVAGGQAKSGARRIEVLTSGRTLAPIDYSRVGATPTQPVPKTDPGPRVTVSRKRRRGDPHHARGGDGAHGIGVPAELSTTSLRTDISGVPLPGADADDPALVALLMELIDA